MITGASRRAPLAAGQWSAAAGGARSAPGTQKMSRFPLLFLTASSLPPGLWMVRNARQGGEFSLSPLSGTNLAYHRYDVLASGIVKPEADGRETDMLEAFAREDGVTAALRALP